MVVENILFIVPPNITYDHFVSPPANVSTTSLGSSARKFGPLVTDIPLGIISLSAYLKERLPLVTRAVDFNVQLLREPDFTHPDFKSYFRRHFEMPDYARFIPTVVALSALFTSSYHNVIDLAEVCCERFPGALILAGGNLCTTLYREFFAATDAIDAICFGEGERPFAELLEAVDRHALLARHSSWITRTKLTMPLSCGGGGGVPS
jgi:radical SAM superfamily enzyme YgiQ (UPF0313 family)